jgi:hypothetical protein
MVLRDDGLRFLQRRQPLLDLQIFIAGDAFDDSAFFDEQLEFAGLIGIAIEFGGEIDAPGGDPIPFYDTLITQPAFPTP